MTEPSLDLRGATVLILGWAGATERHLRPVARWYTDRGGRPLVHRADVLRAMARADGWPAEGRALARRLERATGPIVVHLFSNTGFWTWAAILDAADPATLARVRAVVVDSAPGLPPHIDRRFYARYGAMGLMPLVLRALGRPPSLRHPVLTPAVETLLRLWYHLSPGSRRFSERSLDVVRGASRWPHLFLYSSADALVRHDYVDAFADTLDDEERVRWDDSEHVTHMLRHRAAYFDAVADFLARRLTPR